MRSWVRSSTARPRPSRPPGCKSFLTGTSTGITATVVNGVATVDFHTDPIQVVGPDQTLAIAQVVYTATQQPGVTGVSFEIAGQGIQVPTASGVQVSRPVSRADYARRPFPEATPSSGCGRRPADPRGVAPEMLEIVEGPGLVQEHVDEEVAVVHEHPEGVGQALDPVG